LFGAAVIAVGPAGNFPLNDDWSFATTVRDLLEHGRFHPNAWTAMTLLTHTLWGALFCLPTGFSFNVLRLATVVAALSGAVIVYLAARAMGRRRDSAVLMAGVIALNPISFPLTLTFMTEISFVALVTAASFLFIGHLRGGRRRLLAGATILATLAILCRQVGLFLPAAYAVAAIATGSRRRADLLRALIPLGVGLAALYAFNHALLAMGAMPVKYAEQPPILKALFVSPGIVPKRDLGHAQIVALFMGLFLLPLLVRHPVAASAPPRGRPFSRAFMLILVAVVIGFWVHHLGWMPVGRGNIMMTEGVGPLSLRDTHLLALDHYPGLPGWFWIGLTAASTIGAALLLERALAIMRALWARRREAAGDPESSTLIFCLAAVAIYAFPPIILGFFDRYLIPLLVPLVFLVTSPLATREGGAGRRAVAAAVLVLMAGFSITVTHDYLAWNRARWRLLSEWTLDHGVTPDELDGGFEFNGFHRDPDDLTPAPEGKSWWWVRDDRYLASFGPVPGYEQVGSAEYERWWPRAHCSVLMLRRQEGPESGETGAGR
jgi:hypothetical protein